MKLKNLIIGLIACCAIVPVNAKADSSLIMDCDKITLAPNATTTCSLKGKSDKQITAVDVRLTLGENLSLVSAEVDDIWNGDAENGDYLLAADVEPWPNGEFNIGTFVIKAGNITTGIDTNITITNPLYNDENFDDVTLTDVTKQIRIASSVNTLSKLTVDGQELDLTKDLKVTLDKDSTKITATATDTNSKITGIGDVELKYGENKIEVKVTSEAGTTKVYTVLVTRPDNRNTDNTLSKLTIDGKEVDLTKELAFEMKAESVIIEATASNELATIVGDIGKLELKKGENNFTIKVTAENETVKEYKIKITTPGAEDNKIEGDGPKTGIVDYILPLGGITLIAGIGAYIILKKKNKLIKF